jgi:hypothetical protein
MIVPCISVVLTILFVASPPARAQNAPWSSIPTTPLATDLKLFWNVAGGDDSYNVPEAQRHGFELADVFNTYADYPGKQRQNIQRAIKGNRTNPWLKPPFFEAVIRRNISLYGKAPILIHDIEIDFEEDPAVARQDLTARQAAKTGRPEDFAGQYQREWATWFTLPLQWAREIHPHQRVGLYGLQPFPRDYWNLSEATKSQRVEARFQIRNGIWKHVDPFVDFYIASIYVFYDRPDSLFYMAANIEESLKRTRQYGSKPVYAYVWLRYHTGGDPTSTPELSPYLAEAAAVVPFFSGARGLVLFGWEPGRKGQYYARLPVFMNSLRRVSDLAEKIARATPTLDPPATSLWWERRPLIRKLQVSSDECVFLASNPWQADTAKSVATSSCGNDAVRFELVGRHSQIYHFNQGVLKIIPNPGG